MMDAMSECPSPNEKRPVIFPAAQALRTQMEPAWHDRVPI